MNDINDFVFLDIETTGLDIHEHEMIELSYAVGNDEIITLYPEFLTETFATADSVAMSVNKFFQRFEGVDESGKWFDVPTDFSADKDVFLHPEGYRIWLNLPQSSSENEWNKFAADVKGKTIVGANPRFDMAFLDEFFYPERLEYTHRLFDVQNYAAGVFHWRKPKSLKDTIAHVNKSLDILDLSHIPSGNHVAAGDVAATRALWYMLTVSERPTYGPDGYVDRVNNSSI